MALTVEPALDVEKINQFAEQLQVSWPIGYGANETTSALKVRSYPTTFVIGRSGKVVWRSFQTGTLARAIRRAL